jgi:hypothetical protein
MEIEFVKLSSQRMVSGWRSNLRNFHLRSKVRSNGGSGYFASAHSGPLARNIPSHSIGIAPA